MLSQNRSVCDIKAYQNVDKTCQFVLYFKKAEYGKNMICGC